MAIIDDVIAKLKAKKPVIIGNYSVDLSAPGVKSYGFEEHIVWTKDHMDTKYIHNLDTGAFFSYKDN